MAIVVAIVLGLLIAVNNPKTTDNATTTKRNKLNRSSFTIS